MYTRVVAILGAFLLTYGCGAQTAGRPTSVRTLDLKQADSLFDDVVPVVGGTWRTRRFEPRFTVVLPERWVVSDDSYRWFVADFYYMAFDASESPMVSVNKIDGVVDAPRRVRSDFDTDLESHRQPLPADMLAWLQSRPELIIRRLTPRPHEYARVQATVKPWPAKATRQEDCWSQCTSLFLLADAPSEYLVRGLSTEMVYDLGFLRVRGATILIIIEAARDQFEEYFPAADSIIRTMDFS